MSRKPANIFDAHFHVGAWGRRLWGDPPRSIRPINPERDHHGPAECSRHLDNNGFSAGLVVPTYLPDPTVAFLQFNPLVLQAVKADRRLLGALWVSPQPAVFHLTGDVLKADAPDGIRAAKMSPSTWGGASIDPATWSAELRRNLEFIFNFCRERGWVVHLHTGSGPGDPDCFAPFMGRYGNAATWQLVHMGESLAQAFKFVPDFRNWIESGYDVYCDTSLVPGFAPSWLAELLDGVPSGHDRILFATDAPWGTPAAELAKIESGGIPPEIGRRILWDNADRLYRLNRRLDGAE